MVGTQITMVLRSYAMPSWSDSSEIGFVSLANLNFRNEFGAFLRGKTEASLYQAGVWHKLPAPY